MSVERNAWRAWLTTPPTTMASVVATLEHASRCPYNNIEGNDIECVPYDLTNLMESTQSSSSDIVEAGQRSPQMIARAMRQIRS